MVSKHMARGDAWGPGLVDGSQVGKGKRSPKLYMTLQMPQQPLLWAASGSVTGTC